MKYLIILLVFISNISNAQFCKKDFTKISDKVLIYNYEVSSKEYNLFLKSTNYDIQYLPNKLVLKDTSILNSYNELGNSYFIFDTLSLYPITGLKANQAESFCNWLNTYLNTKSVFKGKIKTVRLPTLSEYYSVLLNYTINADYVDNSVIRLNEEPNMETPLMYKDVYKKTFNEENLSGYIDGYIWLKPNTKSKEIVNLIGNVSEMVYTNSSFIKIIPIGNNFSGKIYYANYKRSNPIISLFDDKLPLTSLKVGFRFVIEYK